MTRPIVGDAVHYVARGSADGVFKPECCAAIITKAPAAGRGRPTKKLDLFVMTPTGNHHQSVLQDEDTKAGGTWHFIERDNDEPKSVKAAKSRTAETPATDAVV